MTGSLFTDAEFPPTPASTPPPAGARLLLLEDDLFFGPFLRDTLTRCGFHVWLVENGDVGLEVLLRDDYDHVICDIDLDGLNGIALYHRIGELRPALCPRFVFISGSPDNLPVAAFIEAIQGKIVYKPFRMPELLSLL